MLKYLLTVALISVLSSPLLAQQVADVAVADEHGCANYDDGSVYCWGGFPGEDIVLPFAAWKVENLPPARRISVGRLGACAIDRRSSLWCWGLDLQRSSRRQEPLFSIRPALVEGLPPVSDVAIGYLHICAIAESEGTVWCWGENACGELGCGDLEPRSEPTRVPLVKHALRISAGVNNTCIVIRGGRISCWGSDNPTMPHLEPFVYNSPTPLIFDETAIGGLVEVANGRNFACGIRTDGKVSCWGSNIMGQLGTDSPRLGYGAAGIGEVDEIDAAEDLDASYFNACAVQSGDVLCWGNNEPGALTESNAEHTVHRFASARKTGVGSLFNCALAGERVLCWGSESVSGEVLLPGMSMTDAAPVPGLPGEADPATLRRRLFVLPVEIVDLIDEGEPLEALRLIDRLQADRSDETYLRELEIDAHFEAARAASDLEDADSAFLHYSQAILLSPAPFAAALNNRAMIFAKRGDFESALADIDLALSAKANSSLYLANKCLVLRQLDNLEAAILECEKAATGAFPTDQGNQAWIFLQRGLTLREFGDVEGSVEDFVSSVENAEASTILRIQQLMTAARLYSGPINGEVNDSLRDAIAVCVLNDECFNQASAQMSKLVEFLE